MCVLGVGDCTVIIGVWTDEEPDKHRGGTNVNTTHQNNMNPVRTCTAPDTISAALAVPWFTKMASGVRRERSGGLLEK